MWEGFGVRLAPHGPSKSDGRNLPRARCTQSAGAGVERCSGRVDVVDEQCQPGRRRPCPQLDRATRVGEPRRPLEPHLRRRAPRSHEGLAKREPAEATESAGYLRRRVETVAAPAPRMRRHRHKRPLDEIRRRAPGDLGSHEVGDRNRTPRLQRTDHAPSHAFIRERGPGTRKSEAATPAFPAASALLHHRRAAAAASRGGKRDEPGAALRAERRAGELGLAAVDAQGRHQERDELTAQSFDQGRHDYRDMKAR
jgi:hypothetical protein